VRAQLTSSPAAPLCLAHCASMCKLPPPLLTLPHRTPTRLAAKTGNSRSRHRLKPVYIRQHPSALF
jgi:hypothetical protein